MEQSKMRRIGLILKEKRLQLGYTQEYAAEKTGISYSYYTKIERGEQLPSLEVALQLAEFFRLSLDYWFFNDLSDHNVSPAARDLIEYLKGIDTETIAQIQLLLQKASLIVTHD